MEVDGISTASTTIALVRRARAGIAVFVRRVVLLALEGPGR